MLALLVYAIIQLLCVILVIFLGSYLGVKNTDLYLASCFFLLLSTHVNTLLYAKKNKSKSLWFGIVILSIVPLFLCLSKANEDNQTVFEKPLFFTYNDNSEYIRDMLGIMDNILYNYSSLKEFRLVNVDGASTDSFTYDDEVDLFNLRFVSSVSGYTASYLKGGAKESLFAGARSHNKILNNIISDLPMLKDVSALNLNELDLLAYNARIYVLENDLSLIDEPFTINKESKGIKYVDYYYYGEYIFWIMMWINITLGVISFIKSISELFTQNELDDVKSVA